MSPGTLIGSVLTSHIVVVAPFARVKQCACWQELHSGAIKLSYL